MSLTTWIQLGKFVPVAYFTLAFCVCPNSFGTSGGRCPRKLPRLSPRGVRRVGEAARLRTGDCGETRTTDDRLAASLSNLGTVYRAQGRYAEAEKLYRRALELREGNFGAAHPEVAVVVNNLATLYHAEGRTAEAEPLFRRALAIWEQFPGQEDRHLATALNNLAGIYRATSRFAEAKPALPTGFGSFPKGLRSRQMPTLRWFSLILACSIKTRANMMPPPKLHSRALAIRERALGPDHPDFAAALSNLARCLSEPVAHGRGSAPV